jgi:predicted ATPase
VPAIYAVEQPELHLHPRLQARLADMLLAITKLARAQGIDLRLVVETHSESIVNRLGNHAASDAELRQLVSIVLFERDNPKQPTRVRVADFDERGFLKNWPFGFFEPDPIMSPNADHPS